jgi:hypothetical protein
MRNSMFYTSAVQVVVKYISGKMILHYCCEHLGYKRKITQKPKYDNSTPLDLKTTRAPTIYESKKEFDLSALYNPDYSGIQYNEIFSKSNHFATYTALGFKWLHNTNN